MSLSTLYGHHYEKLAIETALIGDYSIAFIGDNGNGDIPLLAALAALDPAAPYTVLRPCPEPTSPPCRCTPETLATYRETVLRPEQLTYDITVRVGYPSPAPEGEYIDPRYADDALRRRVDFARAQPEPELHADAQMFLDHQRARLHIPEPWPRIGHIAGSIARRRGSRIVETPDMAEAIFYRLVKLPEPLPQMTPSQIGTLPADAPLADTQMRPPQIRR